MSKLDTQNSSAVHSHEQLSDAAPLTQHAEAIRKLHKRAISDVIEIGGRLSECKRRLAHGRWLPWLEREFAWTERTARNYMAVHEFFAKSETVADLSIDLTSLYRITAPSTPADARAEVIGRVRAGEALSRGEIQRVVQQAKHHQTGRRPDSIGDNEIIHGSGAAVLKRLSGVEQALCLEFAKDLELAKDKDERPEAALETALEWAEARAGLKKSYRNVLSALHFADLAARTPIREIVAAVPQEQRAATARRLREAADFLVKLCSKMM
jgi:Protein of unknown function (DUF3102)